MEKSPQEMLNELEDKAKVIRNYIEAERAFKELQASNNPIESPAPTVALIQSPLISSRNLITRGRKPKNSRVIDKVADLITAANKFVRYSEIRSLIEELKQMFPEKSEAEIDKRIRDDIYRDRNSSKPTIVHIAQANTTTGQTSHYIYGLTKFLDENKKPKPQYMA